MYNEKIEKGMEPEQIMKGIFAKGRDNARTPMQWDNSEQSGFSTGKPWINVNPNYVDINAKSALKDPDSIFYYYKKLIALRKEMRIIVEGSFELIEAENQHIFAYMRHLDNQTLLVLTNFSGGEQSVAWPDSIKDYHGRKIISNYSDRIMQETAAETILRPWEAIVYLIER